MPAALAILVRALDGGGMQRNVARLAAAFQARGLAVDVLAAEPAGPMRAAVAAAARLVPLAPAGHLGGRLRALLADPAGFAVNAPLLLGGPAILRHLPAVEAYLRAVRPAALLSLGTQCNLAALWARRLAGVATRIVVSEHNPLSVVARSSRRRFRHAYPAAVARAYPAAAAIVAVSEAVADDLAAATGLDPAAIATVPNPVVDAGSPAGSRRPPPHPWLEPGAPPVVLGVGRLHPNKLFADLLEAFAALRAVRPARLVILGEGPERAALAARARTLGIEPDLLMPGFVSEPEAWMAHAGVLALTSRHEGFGNVLIEAMAVGCPVVATDCPGAPRELLGSGRLGRLVEPGMPLLLAEALLATLAAPPDRARLRAAAAAFGIDRAAERYLALLLPEGAHGRG